MIHNIMFVKNQNVEDEYKRGGGRRKRENRVREEEQRRGRGEGREIT